MREEQKEYIRDLYRQIQEAEQQMRDKPMPKLTKKDFFLFHETGNRLVYENAYFGRRKYLTVYAILALWSEELSRKKIIDEKIEAPVVEAYVKRLEEIMVSICCEEQFWALPAHVDFDQIDLPKTAYTVDLFAAETAQALSEVTLRLYDKLSCETVTCVAREVTERVLQPFALSSFPYSWWETDRCNWSAVCAGSIGMTAIKMDALNRKIMKEYMPDNCGKDTPIHLDVLLYRDCFRRLPSDWKKECMRRVRDALGCYLDGMEADGACTEGLGYYNYGMSFYAAFAEEYGADGCPGQEPERLMYREKCEQIALFQQKCYFGSRSGGGISVSFSDGSKHESFLPGLTAYLKHCYPQVQTPDYTLARPFGEDACYRYLTNERNIRWLMRYAASDEAMDSTHQCVDRLTAYLLPAAQWLICQDEDGNGFAAKGGNNSENHNHNDIGHFLCVFQGEMLLTDLGAGEYTKDYFSDKRYEILCNRSMGHSVPIINGGEQCAGAEYSADRFVWDEVTHTLTISFAGAYPKGSIGELVRQIKLCDRNAISIEGTQLTQKMQIELQDFFAANENTKSITENIVTEYEPAIQDGVVWIRGQHGQCSIQIENDIDHNAIKIIPCAHRDHSGNSQTIYRIIWEIDVKKYGNTSCKMWITFYDNKFLM
ncbi:MAG: heparinase II/III family protein [Lachnospiraceae bacterium]|nr:heparinase II/III family protein [Lachnospiraceae bacterium]